MLVKCGVNVLFSNYISPLVIIYRPYKAARVSIVDKVFACAQVARGDRAQLQILYPAPIPEAIPGAAKARS